MRKENIVYSLNIFNGIIFWNSLSQIQQLSLPSVQTSDDVHLFYLWQ